MVCLYNYNNNNRQKQQHSAQLHTTQRNTTTITRHTELKKDYNKQKTFFDNLALSKGFQPTDPEGWYNITSADVEGSKVCRCLLLCFVALQLNLHLLLL